MVRSAMRAGYHSSPVKEGDVLAGKYRIEQVIGVGGMGIVVSAMHLELDRRVALKFLLPQAADNDELVGRFLREAKASRKLQGEHVTQVLDVGLMDDGRAYIVMEYLDGADLGAVLKEAQADFPIADVVGWMLQTCEGLAEAHTLGIVHRDLKPGNLFLTRRPDGRAHVKVLDFGISKSIDPTSTDMLSLTKTEMLLGSPLYMAPEQMRSSKYVDERSDIWALGAISYELLTRRVPFEAETILDLCFKVAQEHCTPIEQVRPEVPPMLAAAVMRCLEKEPDARWGDIGELAMALEPFAPAEDKGSAARTVAILERNEERARARRASKPMIPALPRKPDPRRSEPNLEPLAHAVTESIGPKVDESVPASSAWGGTRSELRTTRKRKSRTGLYAGIALAATGGLGAFWFASRPAPPAPAPLVVTTAAASPPPPAVAPPPPKAEPSAKPAPTPESPAAEPAVAKPAVAAHVHAPRPAAKPVASVSASVAQPPPPPPPAATTPPPAETGFLRVRE